jgi:hypothetical protein
VALVAPNYKKKKVKKKKKKGIFCQLVYPQTNFGPWSFLKLKARSVSGGIFSNSVYKNNICHLNI